MMAFSSVFLKGFMILYFAKKFVNADECIVSKSTVKNVKSCPQTAEEWGNAADKKGCESLNHSFIYHCVMNTWRNETVEVCALSIRIVGLVCPEYNVGGCRIQRGKDPCSECPVSYNSSESYLYQECYRDGVTYSLPSTTYSSNVKASEGHILHRDQKQYIGNIMVVVICAIICIVLITSFMTYIYLKEKDPQFVYAPLSVRLLDLKKH